MKVLEKGRKQTGWATERKCTGWGNGNGGCGAKLLVEYGDLYFTYSSCMGEEDAHVTFKCPDCGVETDLPTGNVPSAIWDKIPRRGKNK